jgi:YVTN family beta-propeller protein
MIPAMMQKPFAFAAAVLIAPAPGWSLGSPATAAEIRAGHVLVANQQSASASLIDLATGAARVIPVGAGPHEAVIAPSGRVAVVTVYGVAGAPGNELAVIDVPKGVVSRTISLGQYTRPHGAMFLPGDETRVVVTSETTQNVVIVKLDAGKVERAIPTNAAGSHMVAVTADGTRAFTSDVGAGAVSEIDLAAGAFVRVIPVAPQVEGVAVTPDGSAVWAGSNLNGTVSVIDTKTGAIATTITGFTMPYRLAMSADGRTAIVCDPKGDRIHVADVAARKVVWTLDGIGSPRGVNISPDGSTAFVTLAADETMGVIDLKTRTLTRKIKVQASPDGVWYGPAPAFTKGSGGGSP